ncbi:MAG: acyl carrier protein [Chloroflexota bacterium]
MDRQNKIAHTVRELIVYLLGVEGREIRDDMSIRGDLGADSLDMAEIIVMLGREFDINVYDEEVAQITTLGEAITYIQRQSDERVVLDAPMMNPDYSYSAIS